jgi:uncharacterized surface protein with fasciclin (FAS1) repeats
MYRFQSLAFAATLTLALAACSDDDATTTPPPASGGSSSGTPAPETPSDIVDTAVSADQFTTLVAAVQAADLEATLRGPGPFTVFAPTDAAFAKLPAGTVEDLVKPENKEKLTAILTYHVVSGRVTAADVAGLTSATTVNGQDVTVGASDGAVTINDAKVVQADVEASNGIIHVIDTVLLPE